jgi:hypothetical protein
MVHAPGLHNFQHKNNFGILENFVVHSSIHLVHGFSNTEIIPNF